MDPDVNYDSDGNEIIKKPRKQKKKKLGRAPMKIIPIKNPDKKKHEYYKSGTTPSGSPNHLDAVYWGR